MQICANGRSGQLTDIMLVFPANKLIRQQGFASKVLNYSGVKAKFNTQQEHLDRKTLAIRTTLWHLRCTLGYNSPG